MPAGDTRPEFGAMLRAKAGLPHDPGDPGGDVAVSRVTHALRDLGVEGQAVAVDVLGACGGAGLNPAQTKAVLVAFARPGGTT